MTEKKLSIKYLNHKMKKETSNLIKTLEERINTVKIKKLLRKESIGKNGRLDEADYIHLERRNLN